MMRATFLNRLVLSIVLTLSCTSAVAAVGSMFWMPIADGTTWTFQISGQKSDSNGGLVIYGPTTQQVRFAGISYQVIDHLATLTGLEGGGTPPAGGGFYLKETANGYFTVSDGNPNSNQWYEYYTDPSPFMTKDSLAVGESGPTYSGNWRGQWELPVSQGGGFEEWAGTWSTVITNMGPEEVTTPLGTFQAVKFRDETTDTKAPNASHLNQSTQTSYAWLVDGIGMVKRTESWLDQSDFNGDGEWDWWERDDSTWYAVSAVPVPAAAWLFGSGLLGLMGIFRRTKTA